MGIYRAHTAINPTANPKMKNATVRLFVSAVIQSIMAMRPNSTNRRWSFGPDLYGGAIGPCISHTRNGAYVAARQWRSLHLSAVVPTILPQIGISRIRAYLDRNYRNGIALDGRAEFALVILSGGRTALVLHCLYV